MAKTKTVSRKIKNRRKTMRNKSNTAETRAQIVRVFLEMLNNVKLYHWKTKSYSQHKATDELYERLNENIDKFVEILLGKNTYEFKSRMYEYREFLTEMNTIFDSKKDSDLLNVRDEILGDINQFLYLLTFNKA